MTPDELAAFVVQVRAECDAALRTSSSGQELVQDLGCSFCGKDQNEVRKLIAGMSAYICEGCVAPCVDILTYEAAYWR